MTNEYMTMRIYGRVNMRPCEYVAVRKRGLANKRPEYVAVRIHGRKKQTAVRTNGRANE